MAPRRKSFALFILLTIAFISIYRIGVEFNENSKRLRVGYKKPTYLKQPWYLFKHRCWHKFCTGNSSYSIKNVSWNMVIMVKSSANSFIRRDVLRRSWASLFYVEGGNVSVVFVVGKSVARKTERRLVEEQAKYGDILQFNGPDDYRNIALKTLAGMEWASVYLPEKFLYSSMDDDFMVDMLKFSKAIRTGFDNMTKKNWFEYPLICMFRMGVDEKPVREKGGLYQKWYIDESLFKWPVFPRYCH
uniref:Hexosyltransferase n=1 Tax=Ciona savignyi TaxID=51511 RepID=H2YSG9_CIOSA